MLVCDLSVAASSCCSFVSDRSDSVVTRGAGAVRGATVGATAAKLGLQGCCVSAPFWARSTSHTTLALTLFDLTMTTSVFNLDIEMESLEIL